MNGQDLIALLRLSLTRPVEGGQAIIRLNLDMATRWALFFAAILLGLLLAYVAAMQSGQTGALPPPLVLLAAQVGINLAVVGAILVVGRMMGGTGRFDDTVLLVGAFQAIMFVLQVVQLVVALLVPPLEFPIVVMAVGLGFWLITGFICALHGFESQIKVLLGVFLSAIPLSFVIGLILYFLGIDIPGMTADV